MQTFILVIFLTLFSMQGLAKFRVPSPAMYKVLGEIGLSDVEVEVIVDKTRINQTEKEIRKLISFLESQGVEDVGGIIWENPSLLRFSVSKRLIPMIEFLEELGVEDISKLIEKFPQILTLSIKKNVLPKIEYFRSIGVDELKVLKLAPTVFGLSLSGTIKPRVRFYKKLRVNNLAKVINTSPVILVYDEKESIPSKIDYYNSLGVTKIAKSLEKFPSFFNFDIEENLPAKIRNFRNIEIRRIAYVIETYPPIVGLDPLDNIWPKVDYFKSIEIKDIGTFIEKCPSVMGLSLEKNIKPTIESLVNKWGFSITFLEENPVFISASLKRFSTSYDWFEDLEFSVKELQLVHRKKLVRSLTLHNVVSKISEITDIDYDSLLELKISVQQKEEVLNLLRNKESHRFIFTTRKTEEFQKKMLRFKREFKSLNSTSDARVEVLDEETIKLKYFDSIGVKDVDDFVKRAPSLLASSLEKNIKPTIDYLISKGGFSVEYIEENPFLIGSSLKRFSKVYDWFEKLGSPIGGISEGYRREIVKYLSLEGVVLKISEITDINYDDLLDLKISEKQKKEVLELLKNDESHQFLFKKAKSANFQKRMLSFKKKLRQECRDLMNSFKGETLAL